MFFSLPKKFSKYFLILINQETSVFQLISQFSPVFCWFRNLFFASATVDIQFKVGSEPPGDAEKHIEKSIGVWRDLNLVYLAVLLYFYFSDLVTTLLITLSFCYKEIPYLPISVASLLDKENHLNENASDRKCLLLIFHIRKHIDRMLLNTYT